MDKSYPQDYQQCIPGTQDAFFRILQEISNKNNPSARILIEQRDLLHLHPAMNGRKRHIVCLAAILALLLGGVCFSEAAAQRKRKSSVVKAMEEEKAREEAVMEARRKAMEAARPQGELLQFIVEDGDTIFVDELQAARIWQKLPRQKGREWRKYYRLVHNFSKAYPYALVAKKLVIQADSTIAADKLKGAKREKYIAQVQEELFDVFEGQMRKLTVSQGALIMKLIDREVGKSSYNIIKGYKSGVTAGFWQGIAKMFGSDLKAPYDPEGEDEATEELVKLWEAGEFDGLYYSLFWKWPPTVDIPSKYL